MVDHAAEAKRLLQSMVHDYERPDAGGSFSCAVYDTAWVSMLTKRVNGEDLWLFPAAFNYVLKTQELDGGWESYAAEIDGILNTSAALLALCRHRDAHLQLGELVHLDIHDRISRAEAALRKLLQGWDVVTTLHVGYEIIVPGLLQLLAETGISFDFSGKKILLEHHAYKMSRFDPQIFYQEKPISALHSLEAFIGKVDFERLKHHVRKGSMMGSPSSTAAYLQYSTEWNESCEKYLYRVLSGGAGKGNGGFPSAYPTTNFEIIWVRARASLEYIFHLTPFR